jgi:hypothetical protein
MSKKFLARKYFITNSIENEHQLEKELLKNAASPAETFEYFGTSVKQPLGDRV